MSSFRRNCESFGTIKLHLGLQPCSFMYCVANSAVDSYGGYFIKNKTKFKKDVNYTINSNVKERELAILTFFPFFYIIITQNQELIKKGFLIARRLRQHLLRLNFLCHYFWISVSNL